MLDIKKKIVSILLMLVMLAPVPAFAATESDLSEGAAAATESDLSAAAAAPVAVLSITLNASGEDGVITAVWNAIEGADYYLAYIDGSETPVRVNKAASNVSYKAVFTVADLVSKHTVTVKAYQLYKEPAPEPEPADGSEADPAQDGGVQPADAEQEDADDEEEPVREDVLVGEGRLDNISAVSRPKLSDGSRSPKKLSGVNLKKLLGEKYNGYSVVQGGCTDGVFAYYLMVSSANQNGRILKMTAGGKSVIDRSGVITISHGNGMAFDSARNRLVIVGRESWRNRITTVDASNLTTVNYYDINYSYPGKWTSSASKGISSIAYIKKYDCFLAVQRSSHNLLVLDPEFRVIGLIKTDLNDEYPGTYQAMDADDRYAYLLISYYNSDQPYNRILVLDWNSENMLEYANGQPYISKMWWCNNDGSGTPDAVIRTKNPHEAENIYHIEQADGTSRFYLSEYYNNPKTKYVTKKKAYKVKWKKVRKKVKVKWKKVNGKWKYKKKWKKVWKYKKKYKKVKVKKGTYLNRDNYVYDLGIM